MHKNIEIEKKYKSIKHKLHYSLTTNGLLLKDEKFDFLVKHNFSVAISIDGPKAIHDK